MARRPPVERMIKCVKCDLGDDRLSKRGKEYTLRLPEKQILFEATDPLLRNKVSS
jgi:hypothetical protein